MRKTCYLLFAIIFNVSVLWAQQRPQYTQYVLNNYLLNPALSGMENYTDIKMGHRTQWSGLEGAPVTSYLTINMPIGKDYLFGDATGMPSSGGTNPMSRQYSQYYMAAEPHHGVGLMVVNDVAGPINQTNINATYAYHLGLAPKVNLAVGVSGGINYNSLNTSKLTFESGFDPIVNSGSNSKVNPDLSVGVWGYSSNWYVGASVQQVLPQRLYVSNGSSTTNAVPHYFATAGIKIFLTDDFALLPSTLVKVIQPLPISYDINAKLAFRDRLWAGVSVRKDDSFGAMLGININSLINVSYSYDYVTSPLRTVSNGSHEIVLGILLNNRYKVMSPQIGF